MVKLEINDIITISSVATLTSGQIKVFGTDTKEWVRYTTFQWK